MPNFELHTTYLKWDVNICDGWWTVKTKIEQDARGLIEKFIAIHENGVTPLADVKLFHKPCPRSFCNLACGNQEYMIEQNLPIGFRVENQMVNGHARLIQDGRYVVIFRLRRWNQSCPFYLGAEIYPVASWQLIFHPEVLAKFESLFSVASWTDAVRAAPLKQRDKDFLGEFILAGCVEKIGKLLALCDLILRQPTRPL